MTLAVAVRVAVRRQGAMPGPLVATWRGSAGLTCGVIEDVAHPFGPRGARACCSFANGIVEVTGDPNPQQR